MRDYLRETPVEDIINWAKKTGTVGKLIITIPEQVSWMATL
jgi:hypothetical protein